MLCKLGLFKLFEERIAKPELFFEEKKRFNNNIPGFFSFFFLSSFLIQPVFGESDIITVQPCSCILFFANKKEISSKYNFLVKKNFFSNVLVIKNISRSRIQENPSSQFSNNTNVDQLMETAKKSLGTVVDVQMCTIIVRRNWIENMRDLQLLHKEEYFGEIRTIAGAVIQWLASGGSKEFADEGI
ncbi:hypothetical protein RFI_40363 [Reticulomyxa filosa]|uniref:Uncharacterized protein n=1 Tax=Reticulomyxa filosa TaxID=46433 RepID=X6L810_RETFI|nr:hypothetical protein RFI_40363 [Reticulomyxa filosa]|eukprot:ETN97166.1 hypothetical protein RFI_40363 [Reticulomyxa filosa]